MTTYYINPGRTTNGVGTEEDPFNSWTAITLGAGDSFLQLRGTSETLSSNLAVTGANGTATAPITFGAYGDASLPLPIIKFSSTAFLNITGTRTFINIEDLEIDSRASTAASCITVSSGCTDINITGCRFKHIATSACIQIANSSTVAVQRLAIENCEFVAGFRGVAFLGNSATASTHTGWYVRNCTFGAGMYNGVRLTLESAASASSSLNDVEVSGCTFNGVLEAAINIKAINLANSDTTAPTFWGKKLRIFNNVFHDCGLSVGNTSGTCGFPFWDDVMVYNNEFVNCSTTGGLLQGTHRRNFLIYDNVCIGAIPVNGIDGCGIFADRFDNNGKIFRNKIKDNRGSGVANSGEGISVWMCTNIDIFRNYIENTQKGIGFGGNATQATSGIRIYKNTLVNIAESAFESDSDGTGLASTAVSVYDNIVVNAAIGFDGAGAPQDNADGNIYINVTTTYDNSQAAGAADQTFDTPAEAGLTENFIPVSTSTLVNAAVNSTYEQPLGMGIDYADTPGAFAVLRQRGARIGLPPPGALVNYNVTPGNWQNETASVGANYVDMTDSTIYSRVFNRRISFSIGLPVNYATNGVSYPVVWHFHGQVAYPGTNNRYISASWPARYGQAVRDGFIRHHITVFVNGLNYSMYVNSADGALPWEKFFMEELFPYIHRTYRTLGTGRQYNATMGFSMGGRGSLYYALKYRQHFCAVNAYGPPMYDENYDYAGDSNLDDWAPFVISPTETYTAEERAVWLAKSPQGHLNVAMPQPKVRIVYGDSDNLRNTTGTAFKARMALNGVAYTAPTDLVGVSHTAANYWTNADTDNAFAFVETGFAGA